MPALGLLELLGSKSTLESALALACVNAVINTPDKAYTEGASITQLAFSADTPVTLLSAIVVEDAAGLLQAVSEGGGTPAVRPCTRKVNLRCH